MKNLSFAAIAALLLSVAASAQDGGKWEKLEGQHSRIATLRTVAVSDAASWEKVWKEHSADAPVPAVDFSKESVVAVFLGEKTTAGVKVEIVVQQDPIDSGRLNVFYKEVSPKTKGFAASVICRPYAMVKVAKAKTVAFEANGRVTVPEKLDAGMNPHDATKVRILLDSLASFDGR